MKGAIFNLFEEFVSSHFGEDVYDQIVDLTPLETAEPFVGPGRYPASDLLALVATATEVLDIALDDALRAFGAFSFPHLARSVEPLIAALPTAREFLLGLESVIHTEIRKLDPASQPARFTVEEAGNDVLRLHYRSDLGLFALVSGFLDGVAAWYGEPLDHRLDSTDGTNGTFTIRFVTPVGQGVGSSAASTGHG